MKGAKFDFVVVGAGSAGCVLDEDVAWAPPYKANVLHPDMTNDPLEVSP